MTLDARIDLRVMYHERQDVLEARRPDVAPDATHDLEADTTLHYCVHTQQVVGVTLRRFLTRFPLMGCTLDIDDHGAAVAREYLAAHPTVSA